jgi:hypothetical protein
MTATIDNSPLTPVSDATDETLYAGDIDNMKCSMIQGKSDVKTKQLRICVIENASSDGSQHDSDRAFESEIPERLWKLNNVDVLKLTVEGL